MSNPNICKNCGAVITDSSCDYCGDGANTLQSNIKKTKNARKIKELEKEIQKYHEEMDKLNEGRRNGCLFYGMWIIGILVIVAIISLFFNNWKSEAVMIWCIVIPVFAFLLFFICRALDKDGNVSIDNQTKKIREQIEELEWKIEEIKNS